MLAEPIVVSVTKGDGTPFANKIVTFRVRRSDGRLFGPGPPAERNTEGAIMLQVRTDTDGLARAAWQLGTDAGCGNNRVETTSTSIAGTTFFCASATPAPPVQINIGSGNNQIAEAGRPAPEPLRVWVNDRCNWRADIPVTFTVIRGNGRVNDRTSVTVETGDTGHAQAEFTLGSEAGNNVIEANFATNPTNPARFVIFGLLRDESQPTSFSGIVLNNNEQPIQGATCSLFIGGVSEPSVESDINGLFRFDGISGAGPADLHVDGLTAFHVGGEGDINVAPGSYPALHFEPVLVPNTENSLSTPVLLPPLNPANAREFDNTEDVELTVEGIKGLKMLVRAGSMRLADGSVPSPADSAIIALNQVLFDKIPMPMPDGAAPLFAWTLQPAGATFDPPAEITYPNMSGLPAGRIAYFLSFNHDTMRFEIVATGSVTDDGANIVSDPGAGIYTAGWGCNCPPYSVTGECCNCDDCEVCVDGECVSECGTCETCQGGSCAACGDCEECVAGVCQPVECDECETCVADECQADASAEGEICGEQGALGQCFNGLCELFGSSANSGRG